jgi:hypothetical protein
MQSFPIRHPSLDLYDAKYWTSRQPGLWLGSAVRCFRKEKEGSEGKEIVDNPPSSSVCLSDWCPVGPVTLFPFLILSLSRSTACHRPGTKQEIVCDACASHRMPLYAVEMHAHRSTWVDCYAFRRLPTFEYLPIYRYACIVIYRPVAGQWPVKNRKGIVYSVRSAKEQLHCQRRAVFSLRPVLRLFNEDNFRIQWGRKTRRLVWDGRQPGSETTWTWKQRTLAKTERAERTHYVPWWTADPLCSDSHKLCLLYSYLAICLYVSNAQILQH